MATTSPSSTTVSPDSQVPVSAVETLVLLKLVEAAGAEIASAGAVVSRTSVRVAEPVLPAVSVWAMVRSLLPSLPVKVSATEKALPVQGVLWGEDEMPVLDIVTARPVSQEPVSVKRSFN